MKIKIDQWNGGIADDIYRESANECAYSENIDNYSKTARISQKVKIQEWSTLPIHKMLANPYANNGFIGLGKDDLYSINVLDNLNTFQSFQNLTNEVNPHAFALYANEFGDNFVYWVSYNAGTGKSYLSRASLLTATVQENFKELVDEFGSSQNLLNEMVHIFVAPFDNVLYVAHKNYIAYYDNNNAFQQFSSVALKVKNTHRIERLTYYDNVLMGAMNTPVGSGTNTAKVFLWDTYKPDVEYVKEIANGEIIHLANTGNLIVCVTAEGQKIIDGQNPRNYVNFTIIGYIFNGGLFQPTNRQVSQNQADENIRSSGFEVHNNQLYFIAPNTQDGRSDTGKKYCVWRFGENAGAYQMMTDVSYENITTIPTGDILINGEIYVITNSATQHRSYLEDTVDNTNKYALGTYITTRFYGGVKAYKKKLQSVAITTIAENSFEKVQGEVKIYCRMDNNPNWVLIHTHNSSEHSSENDFKVIPGCNNDNNEWYTIQFKFEMQEGKFVPITEFIFNYKIVGKKTINGNKKE